MTFLDRVASKVGGGSMAIAHLSPSEVFLGTSHMERLSMRTLWLRTWWHLVGLLSGPHWGTREDGTGAGPALVAGQNVTGAPPEGCAPSLLASVPRGPEVGTLETVV